MRGWVVLSFILLTAGSVWTQELKTRNIVIITVDGYRWQELFQGADERILSSERYVSDTSVITRFGRGDEAVKRASLMPFFWNVIAKSGQLYGNRSYGNKVNCSNNYLISYPGYSEMFVGFPGKISSNENKVNPNPTVFEFINRYPDFNREVAAFATWDAFPYILREVKSGIYVNAGKDPATGNLSPREAAINDELKLSGKRTDEQTFDLAFEYLKKSRPRVLFLAFDGTDFHGHGGRYDGYLKSANQADKMIEMLWNWIQSQPDYKDQTTFFITTDHGRGMGKNTWKNHRLVAPGSRHIWFAVMGPDTPAFGELKFKGKYYQKQVAKTLAAFLGMEFQPKKNAGEVIQTMVAAPIPTADEIVLGRSANGSPDR
jgi:hypothetical protein